MKQKFPMGLSHRSRKFMCDFCLSILLHCKIQVVIGHVKASPLADTFDKLSHVNAKGGGPSLKSIFR